jgi:biotin carboxylase
MLIDGVSYHLNWRGFTVGSSFFIPCLAVEEGKARIERKMKRLGFAVIVKIVIEDGVRGLRVWRIKRKLAEQHAVARSPLK